jgi:hypothetical protein
MWHYIWYLKYRIIAKIKVAVSIFLCRGVMEIKKWSIGVMEMHNGGFRFSRRGRIQVSDTGFELPDT